MDAFQIFGAGFFIFILAVAVLCIAGLWKVFEKAGQPGWAAIVPIYNYYIMTKIIGKPGYWAALMIIPYIGVIWAIWSFNLLSKSFGKDTGFTIGIVFLPFIFLPIMGFDKSIQYQGPAGNPGAHNLGDQIQSIGADVK
jgi:hypothetical protein